MIPQASLERSWEKRESEAQKDNKRVTAWVLVFERWKAQREAKDSSIISRTKPKVVLGLLLHRQL